MIDDSEQSSRRRRPPERPGWGDPFASFATLADPAVASGSDPWRLAGGVDDDGLDAAAIPDVDPTTDVTSVPAGGRRPLLVALLRPWFEPRPGELRGAIVLLTLALAASLALWFDASRRPSFEPSQAQVGAPGSARVAEPGVLGGSVPGSIDGSDGWGLPSTTATPRGPVVHVSGAVRDPGVVTLPDGSRVADAIGASGGAMPDARLDRLNLARRVDDGERIHVPRVGEDAPPPEESASRGVLPDGRIDLNAASQAELETLPGVGPARAQAIIAERETRPFRVPGDLRRVPGIGEATFQRLAPLVAVR